MKELDDRSRVPVDGLHVDAALSVLLRGYHRTALESRIGVRVMLQSLFAILSM